MRPAKLPTSTKPPQTKIKSLTELAAKNIVKDRIKFYEDKARETESVITYAKMPVSIADMRHEELDMTKTSRFKHDSSFQNLFDDRLKHMPGN